MNEFLRILDYLRDYNVVSVVVRLILSVLLGGFIGIERGRHGRAAGLRTHILVCLGAAMTSLLGVFITVKLGLASDASRIAAQVISGIGFLGVGTIVIKGRFQVSGLTTAAGLWATAAIGLATGYGFYEGAVLGTILAVLTVACLLRLETRINRTNQRLGIYLELDNVKEVNAITAYLNTTWGASDIQVTPPRSAVENNVGIEATVRRYDADVTAKELITKIAELPHIVYVLESI